MNDVLPLLGRHDALPEHNYFRDTGCELYPSCLNCPLPKCRYEVRGGAAELLRPARDARIRAMHSAGNSITGIAEALGISRRTVFRVLSGPTA